MATLACWFTRGVRLEVQRVLDEREVLRRALVRGDIDGDGLRPVADEAHAQRPGAGGHA
jgi:hypothetical protein